MSASIQRVFKKAFRQRLMTAPGVGAITARTFMVAVDNPGRISKAGDPDV